MLSTDTISGYPELSMWGWCPIWKSPRNAASSGRLVEWGEDWRENKMNTTKRRGLKSLKRMMDRYQYQEKNASTSTHQQWAHISLLMISVKIWTRVWIWEEEEAWRLLGILSVHWVEQQYLIRVAGFGDYYHCGRETPGNHYPTGSGTSGRYTFTH